MKAITTIAGITVFLLSLVGIASSHALWVENGVPIVVETGLQWYHRVVMDGSGGAIVTWSDERSGEYQKDIYAQRIDGNGVVLWVQNGVTVCTADSVQWAPELIADGHDGAIITWCDYRSGGTDIYVQRIDLSGVAMWTADGVSICTAADEQRYPEIVTDGYGGAIIVWEDWRVGEFVGYDIYAQRIDAGGTVKWAGDGVAVCTASSYQSFQKVISDGDGGAIIVWQDTRIGYPSSEIYAQRIDSLGSVLWAADGVAICNASGDHYAPEIVADGSGGAIITWTDERGGDYDIYAQRVDGDGNVQWAAEGVGVCALDSTQWYPVIVSDGAGGAIITWTDKRGLSGYDVYAQRLSPTGTRLWDLDGQFVCTAPGDQGSTEYGYGLQMIADGSGGAIIAWQDKRGGFYYNVYAQRLASNSNYQWQVQGVPVGTSMMNRVDPRLVSDLAGGTIIAWLSGSMVNSDIFAARMDQAGHPVATLLQNYSVLINDFDITLKWTLSEAGENMRFVLFRTDVATGLFEELADAQIVHEGLTFAFRDDTYEPGFTYRYRVEVEDEVGRRMLFETDPVSVPELSLTLFQNHPNPFNPSTTIRYYLPERSTVTLGVYDISGRLVVRLVNKEQKSGLQEVPWDGCDMLGNEVGSGVYFCRIQVGKESISRKMVLLR